MAAVVVAVSEYLRLDANLPGFEHLPAGLKAVPYTDLCFLPVLPSVAIGLVGAALLSQSMASLLFNVKPTAAVYGAVSVVLIAVALLASYRPARRAARIDRLIALRDE